MKTEEKVSGVSRKAMPSILAGFEMPVGEDVHDDIFQQNPRSYVTRAEENPDITFYVDTATPADSEEE